jgi:hypothetical protein
MEPFHNLGVLVMTKNPFFPVLRLGIISGVAGGLAEIAWVSLYAALTGGNPAILARGVTVAAGVNALLPASAVSLGIFVHMTLAVLLGIAATFMWTKSKSTNPYPFMLATLGGVWLVNFFVVLPLVSPPFIHMVPYSVSLTSKLLFGLAAAGAIHWQATARAALRLGSA